MQVTLTNTLPITSPLFHKMEDSVCESVTDNQYSFTFQYLHCSYGSILQYTDLFPGMVRDFCNEFIDNRHIPQHQLPPLHKMGSSVCHSVSDNQSIYVFQYPDLYPEEYFYGVRMFSTKEYTRSLPIQLLLTNIFPNTSYHLSIRWEAAYATRLLITGTVLYSNIRICVCSEW